MDRYAEGSIEELCRKLMPSFLAALEALPKKDQQVVLSVCHYLAKSPPGQPLSFEQMDRLFDYAMRQP